MIDLILETIEQKYDESLKEISLLDSTSNIAPAQSLVSTAHNRQKPKSSKELDKPVLATIDGASGKESTLDKAIEIENNKIASEYFAEESTVFEMPKKSATIKNGDTDSIHNSLFRQNTLSINVPPTTAHDSNRASKMESAFAIRNPSAYLVREKSELLEIY